MSKATRAERRASVRRARKAAHKANLRARDLALENRQLRADYGTLADENERLRELVRLGYCPDDLDGEDGSWRLEMCEGARPLTIGQATLFTSCFEGGAS